MNKNILIFWLFLFGSCFSDADDQFQLYVFDESGHPIENVSLQYDCGWLNVLNDDYQGTGFSDKNGLISFKYDESYWCIYTASKKGFFSVKQKIEGGIGQRYQDSLILKKFSEKICYDSIFVENPNTVDDPPRIKGIFHDNQNREDSLFISEILEPYIDTIYMVEDTIFIGKKDVQYIRLSDNEYQNILQGELNSVAEKESTHKVSLGLSNDNFLLKLRNESNYLVVLRRHGFFDHNQLLDSNTRTIGCYFKIFGIHINIDGEKSNCQPLSVEALEHL